MVLTKGQRLTVTVKETSSQELSTPFFLQGHARGRRSVQASALSRNQDLQGRV